MINDSFKIHSAVRFTLVKVQKYNVVLKCIIIYFNNIYENVDKFHRKSRCCNHRPLVYFKGKEIVIYSCRKVLSSIIFHIVRLSYCRMYVNIQLSSNKLLGDCYKCLIFDILSVPIDPAISMKIDYQLKYFAEVFKFKIKPLIFHFHQLL